MREIHVFASQILVQSPRTTAMSESMLFPSKLMRIVISSDKHTINLHFFSSSIQDEGTTTLAGLLTTPGYSNDITKSPTSGDGKASSRESRGEPAAACDSERPLIFICFQGRSVGGGPMRSRSRNIDTSPYSSTNTAYLSPPESSWRRTSSDSAIHQSLAQAQVRNIFFLRPEVI